MTTGRELAARYHVDGDVPLLSSAWIDRFGDTEWTPTQDDRTAAAKLHAQIASRITTQPLS